MKTENHVITLKSKNPPVVELDSAALAAYVRFSRRKVARTKVPGGEHREKYNHRRPPSSLGDLTPAECAAACLNPPA